MKWMSRILMFALVLMMASLASAETVDVTAGDVDQVSEAPDVTIDLQSEEAPMSTVPETPDFLGTQYDINSCGFPPPTPPTSCVCGGCCECNRCWNGGRLFKCLSNF